MQDSLAAATGNGACRHSDPAAGSRVRVGPRRQEKRPPEIQVRKRDGRIESIVVTCSCGEQVTLVCDYEQEKPE